MMLNTASLLILLLLSITFLQSSFDKVTQWQSNVTWLKGHFDKTFIGVFVPFALGIVLACELLSGVLCGIGIFELMINDGRFFGYYGALASSITLLILFLGQRIAKDYVGAGTICLYFIPAVLAVHWLN
jgi:hypothetical protein